MGRSSYYENLGAMLTRGFRRRCPRCGEGSAFDGYFRLKDRCPSCGYTFYREEGYWTGAMIMNIAACEVWFFLLFIGTLVASWPDIAWGPILIIALVTNGLLPILFYPHSKTLWMAIDLHFHPEKQNL